MLGAEAIEIRLFLEAMHARYGYDLRGYAPTSINRRVLAALAKSGCSHLGELQHRVLLDAGLFATVLDDLTVQTSEMFRDPSFCRAFRTRVVPLLRTYPLLRIWHAGCATGEEAYACAITLTEEGLYERSQLYATDLSVQAVEQAKQGSYDSQRIPCFSNNYLEAGGQTDFSNHYIRSDTRFTMKDTLRNNVQFFQHDLVSDRAFGEMHVIFCRNVFIYFQPELRQRVLHKFAESLRTGGFLCLGTTERIGSDVSEEFEAFSADPCIYRRTSL